MSLRTRALLLAALTVMPLWAAHGQPKRPQNRAANQRTDTARPRKANVYGNDPIAPVKLRIEDLMGFYMIEPPMRHTSERVEFQRGIVQLSYWQPVQGLSEAELITRAVDWFVFGRTQYASGVRGIFSELPNAKQVVVVFHEVIRDDPKKGQLKGRRRAKEQIKPYLILGIDRARFERMDLNAIKRCIDASDCTRVYRKQFAIAKFNRRYFQSRQEEE
ncbi:MAG: hypothetical protein ACE366_17900 [Bradymonadia bacterium]